MVAVMSEVIETPSNATNGPSITNPTKDSAETKRFALICEESIKYIGDQTGLDNISDDAIRLLSSDVSYRLRHLVHNSIELMRQSKRRRLTTKDINEALESSDCEKVLGYEANDTLINETYVKEAKLYVIDDPVIDLNEEVNSILDANDSEMCLFDNNLAISHNVVGEKRYSSSEDVNECNDEQKTYYEAILKAIVGTNDDLFAIAITDLSTNRRLLKIAPHLINLIRTGIGRFNHDIPQLKRFLHTIPCLIRNPSLHLSSEPIQSVIIQSILKCVIEPLNPISDHWNLRDLASHLLANVLNHWFTPLESHRNFDHTFNILRNCLLDFTKPFSCHYGAIKAFQSFGYHSIVHQLYPVLDQYFVHLLSAIETSPDSCQRSDAIKVFGELLRISEMLALKTRSLINNDLETDLNYKDYNLLSEIFGDSLYARLPVSFVKIRIKFYSEKFKNRSESEPKSLFETFDSKKTGEELLDQFYEPTQHIEDMISEMSAPLEDDNSFEDNSFHSDNDREMNPTDLLQVKTTVNDPRLGIKLTIKKLKRDDIESTDSMSDPNRKSSQISEPMFETNCFPTNSPIVFEYGKSKEILRRLFGPIGEPPVVEPSHWFVLTMTQRNTLETRRRRKINRNVRQLSLYSCDLFNVL